MIHVIALYRRGIWYLDPFTKVLIYLSSFLLLFKLHHVERAPGLERGRDF